MKQITITVPDNCELKQDGNTYTIVEKEKKLTYEDIARELFNNCCCYINSNGFIIDKLTLLYRVNDLTNCVTRKQAEKLLAINKLMNVAKYLNDGWQPDWNNKEEGKYYISFVYIDDKLFIGYAVTHQDGDIYFKSEKLAKQAIEILGEETIRIALCTDY